MIAEHGTAQHVEKLVRAYRRCQEAEELSREARQQQTRSVMWRHDDDGSIVLTCRLPAEAGAQILKAMDLAWTKTFQRERRRSLFGSARVARTPSPWWPKVSLRTPPSKLLAPIAIRSWCTWPPRRCETGRRAAASSNMALRWPRRPRAGLSCDASVVALIENDDGEPLNVGRKTRTISAPLRRLLNARDKGCRFPGCANSRYLDAHHIEHWANGGETKPSNLVSLCRFHHRAVHEGGIRIERLDDGALRFVKPNGAAVDSVAPGFTQPLGDWRQLPTGHGTAWRAGGVIAWTTVSPSTCCCSRHGARRTFQRERHSSYQPTTLPFENACVFVSSSRGLPVTPSNNVRPLPSTMGTTTSWYASIRPACVSCATISPLPRMSRFGPGSLFIRRISVARSACAMREFSQSADFQRVREHGLAHAVHAARHLGHGLCGFFAGPEPGHHLVGLAAEYELGLAARVGGHELVPLGVLGVGPAHVVRFVGEKPVERDAIEDGQGARRRRTGARLATAQAHRGGEDRRGG